ncbi:MAG: 2-amino-4-hydroxy-6-hydroxymethyldihydropteridine diphosphokinase [Elusimicrobia bacterium]|nr:2-amino-4-hydroxy-6-hydroxymethyldihydropteridine diphosphokinase [Elusimicrobiota bacterium]MDE2509795.1 2-amino-4-hydroxy-6-hydroxymethyldihydropteridine diphosphokinase [Elusimicrobiota bacterium]
MKQVEALLLLGGNLGDRARTLRRAVASLRGLDGVRVLKVSRLYETAPVGPSEEAYLNQAVRILTARTPMGLLLEAKILEAAAGRLPGVRWGARPLDVDLLSHGNARIKTAWLTVPHPGTPERAFALAPLADVAPEWKPDGKRTVRALLAALDPGPETARRWP